jgi:hypothetical protein
MKCIALELGFGANIQRLENPRIDCRNDIHGMI